MKNSYTGEQFNFIRLFLISRQCSLTYYNRYTSGFYFNWYLSKNAIGVFCEEIGADKQKRIVFLMDLYFSKKEFNYLIGRIK